MEDFGILMDQLQQQADLYDQMLAVSVAQLELARNLEAADDSIDRFLQHLEEREALMDKIDGLNVGIQALRAKLGLGRGAGMENASGLDEEQYQQYLTRIRVLLNTVSSISRNDEACRRLMEEHLNRIGTKLAATRVNRKALKAYMPGGPTGGAWFFDKKK